MNHYFLEEAALIGSGFSSTVGYKQSPELVAEQSFHKINSATVKLESITWDLADVSNIAGTDPGSFLPGMRYNVFGNYKNSGSQLVCVNTKMQGELNSYCEQFEFTEADTSYASISKNWAKQTIKDLEIEVYNDDSFIE